MPSLHGVSIAVPGDPSSAAFAIAAGLICEGSDIVLEGVLMNPTRAGFIETVREMGGDVELLDLRLEGGEPVGRPPRACGRAQRRRRAAGACAEHDR